MGMWRLKLIAVAALWNFGCLDGSLAADANAMSSAVVRGVVRSPSQASITSDLQVPVSSIAARPGEFFNKGAVLIAFDCRRYEAEAEAGMAVLKEMTTNFDNAMYLKANKAGGQFDIDLAKARVEKAAADLKGVETRLSQCAFKAPYDGRVAELTVNVFETPSAGRPIMTLVETGNLEIELIVPSRWLQWLATGQVFAFTVDETGTTERAALIRIGAVVDPVSQTVSVTGRVPVASPKIIPGMSGSADFAQGGPAP